MPDVKIVQATIANGAAESDPIEMQDYFLTGISMPAAWTAASLVPYVAVGGTFQAVENEDGVVEITVTAAQLRVLTPSETAAWTRLKLKSVAVGDPTTAVNQGAARVLTLVLTRVP